MISSLFETLMTKDKRGMVDVECLIQPFDGTPWFFSKSNSSERTTIENLSASLAGFSQPGRFILILLKLYHRRDGAFDRILFYMPKPHKPLTEEIQCKIEDLNVCPVKDLRYGIKII